MAKTTKTTVKAPKAKAPKAKAQAANAAAAPKAKAPAPKAKAPAGNGRTTITEVLTLISDLIGKGKEVDIQDVIGAAGKRGLNPDRIPGHVFKARAKVDPPLLVSRKVQEDEGPKTEYLSLTAAGRTAVKDAAGK